MRKRNIWLQAGMIPGMAGILSGILLSFCVLPLAAQDRSRSTIELPWDGTAINLSEHGIYRASMLSVSGDTVYLFDYSRYRLVRYRDGVAQTVAEGRGGGPEEFQNPTGIDTDRDGNVWIVDPEQARISAWDAGGELIKSFSHLRSIPERIAVHGEEVLIRVRNFSAEKVFHILDRESRPIAGFGGLNDSLLTSRMVITGSLHADETGFYYAPRYAGLFYKFDREGELLYERRTIKPMPVGSVQKFTAEIPGYGTARVTKPPPDEQTTTHALASDSSYLYVLFAGNEDGIGRTVDLYDKYTGAYVRSLGLHQGVYTMDVANGRIYMPYSDNQTGEVYLLITDIPDPPGN